MQLSFGWLCHGDEGDLLQRRQTPLLYRACVSNGYTCWNVEPARIGPIVLCDTRSIPKQDPARIHVSVAASGFRTFVEIDSVVKVNDQLQEAQTVSNAAGYRWVLMDLIASGIS